MIRVSIANMETCLSIPRESGDDPGTYNFIVGGRGYSPRERG